MKIVECVQLSPEWWDARRGLPSASQFGRLITSKTMKPAAAQAEYINELVADTIRLDPNWMTEKPMNPAMRHGRDCEPRARAFYEMDKGVTVRQVGLCISDCGQYCSSPDGLVGEDGALEIKCPEPKTHVSYLLGGVLPDEYRPQVAGHLLVTGRSWCDFLSYADGFPPFMVRVVPDDFSQRLAEILADFLVRYAAAKQTVLAML